MSVKETTAHLSVAMATTEETGITGENIMASTTAAGARFYFQLVVVTIGIIGTMANGFVLYALVASKQHKKHVLIFHQNVLDLFACISVFISYAVKLCNVYLAGSTGYWLCMVLVGDKVIWLVSYCLVINLAIILIERYLKVVHPVWSKKNLRRWMIYSAMAFAWIGPVVDQIVVVAFSKITMVSGYCFDVLITEDKSVKLFYRSWYFLSRYVIILMIFIFCYGRILVAVRRQARVVAGHSATGSVQTTSKKKFQASIINTMIYVCPFYAILWLPNHIVLFLGKLYPHLVKRLITSYHTTLFFRFLYISANPLIHAFKFDPVKQVIIRMIYCNKTSQQVTERVATRHICRIPVSAELSWCSIWSRSMMLWSLHTENTRLVSRGVIFDVSRYFDVTDTFCNKTSQQVTETDSIPGMGSLPMRNFHSYT